MMPGTPVIPAEPKEPFMTYAHRKSIELADQVADPILNPMLFHRTYWIVMGGYGFVPYNPWEVTK